MSARTRPSEGFWLGGCPADSAIRVRQFVFCMAAGAQGVWQVSGKSNIARNALVGALAQIVSLLLGLIATPVQLRALGAGAFGALAVLASLTAYVGILDFGIGGSLVRQMTFYHHRGDSRGVAGVATFGLAVYLAMGVILAPLLYISGAAIGRFLSMPPQLVEQFPVLLVAYFGLYIASSLNSVIGARLISLHRLDLSAICLMSGSAVFMMLMVIALPGHPTLGFVVRCSFTQIAVSALLMLVMLCRVTGAIRYRPVLLTRQELRMMFVFGTWTQLSGVTAVINLEADKAILGHGLGIASVSPYHVANRLAALNRMLPLQIVGAMLPHVTARVSAGISHQDMADLYRDSSRALMISTLCVSGFVASAADVALRFWLGTTVPGAAMLCVAMIASFAVNNATGMGTAIAKAINKPWMETAYGALSSAINVGLTVVLMRPLGLYGVVAGTIIGNVVGSLFFLILFRTVTGMRLWYCLGSWLWRLLIMTAIAMIASRAVLVMLAPMASPSVDRITLLVPLAVSGLCYCTTFGLAGVAMRFWRQSDISIIRGLSNRFAVSA